MARSKAGSNPPRREPRAKSSFKTKILRMSFIFVVMVVALNHFYPFIPKKIIFDSVFLVTKLKVELTADMRVVDGKRVTPEGISSSARALELLFQSGEGLVSKTAKELRVQLHNEFGPLIRSYLPHLYRKKEISANPLITGDYHPSPTGSADFYVLYLHGGGYCSGSAYLYRTFGAEISKRGNADVVVLDYRLAPESPLPGPVKDAVKAYAYMVNDLKISPSKIVIMGDSAGGGLAALTLLELRNLGKPLPAGAVMISAWTDLTGSLPSITTNGELDLIVRDPSQQVAAWATNTSIEDVEARKDPRFSPYFAELHGLPPLLVLVGSIERLRDDSVFFAKRAKEAGVSVELQEWKRMQHVWPVLFPYLPEASEALDEMISFSKRVTSTPN